MSEGAYWAVLTAPILESTAVSDGAKLFYAQVSRRTNRLGYCWASNRTLSEELGVGERTVSRYVAELEAAGFIACEMVGIDDRKRRRERHIRLAVPAPFDVAKNGEIKVAKNGESNVAKNGDTIKVNNKSNKNKPPIVPQAVEKQFAVYAGDNKQMLEALMGFAENRAAIKKPIKSERTAALLLGKLDRIGKDTEERILMLNTATERNWQTVYAPKDREAPPRGAGDAPRQEGWGWQ